MLRQALGLIVIVALFCAGYLAIWFLFSLLATLGQWLLERALLLTPMMESASPVLSGVLLVAAGLYQFAPLKRACLTHCRSPIGFFLTRWRNGPAAGFRIGLEHGIHCLGCCWALMATALAVGVMNLWWMAALAAIALVEQVAPHGDTFRRPLGVALIAAGVWRYTT